MLYTKISRTLRTRVRRPLPIMGCLAAGAILGTLICILAATLLLP